MRKGQIFFAALAVVLFLSGCGRHKDKAPEAGGATTGTTTGGTTEKEFTSFVKELFGATSDTAEPIDIEATTFTGIETDDEAAFDSLLQ